MVCCNVDRNFIVLQDKFSNTECVFNVAIEVLLALT